MPSFQSSYTSHAALFAFRRSSLSAPFMMTLKISNPNGRFLVDDNPAIINLLSVKKRKCFSQELQIVVHGDYKFVEIYRNAKNITKRTAILVRTMQPKKGSSRLVRAIHRIVYNLQKSTAYIRDVYLALSNIHFKFLTDLRRQ